MYELTQEESKKLFNYNQNTGKLFWKKDVSKKVKKGDEAGSVNSCGYCQIRIKEKNYKAHRIIWLHVHGYFPENPLDHINRDRLDNRIENLREVSQQCNLRNTGNFKHNTSGIKGVHFYKRVGKWCAKIMINRKSKSLGSYHDFDNAVCARLAGEQCVNWPGCDSSSPAFKYVQKMLYLDNNQNQDIIKL